MPAKVHHMKIAALKRHIAASSDASTFCKQSALYLIDQTNGLTESVEVSTTHQGLGRAMALGFHDMCSSNARTLLDNFLAHRGLKHVSFHSRTAGRTTSGQIIWAIWISTEDHYMPPNMRKVVFNRSAIQAVVLPTVKPLCPLKRCPCRAI